MTTTHLEVIQVPEIYQHLCADWHSGGNTMMYAVASTGGLTIGNRRPTSEVTREPLTDQQWHLSLFYELRAEIEDCEQSLLGDDAFARQYPGELVGLQCFHAWCKRAIEQLTESYGLEDMDF